MMRLGEIASWRGQRLELVGLLVRLPSSITCNLDAHYALSYYSSQLKIVSMSNMSCTRIVLIRDSLLDCASSGIIRTRSRMELLHARSSVVTAAKAYSLSAIDMVS